MFIEFLLYRLILVVAKRIIKLRETMDTANQVKGSTWTSVFRVLLPFYSCFSHRVRE